MVENRTTETEREAAAIADHASGSPTPPENAENASAAQPESIDHILEGLDYSHPADIAHLLETLPLQTQVEVLLAIDPDVAAEALTELDEHDRVGILESMTPEIGGEFLASMSPDDAADVLDELEEEHRDELLSSLNTKDAAEIRTLMAYDPETAGGVMNTEVFALEQRLTVDQAIAKMRAGIEDTEVPYYAYIVDDDHKLVGVLSLRDLMLARPGTFLADRMAGKNVISVTADTDEEEVARVMSHYNFMALPVVDDNGIFLGAVTHDDVMDILQETASEDMLGMVGAGQDESVDTPWKDSVRMRLPWLLLNMLNSALSAGVVFFFDGTIEQMAILAVFMPMVANQAGNTGQQALAVMIRQLATEGFERKKALHAVWREGKISIVNGVIIGVIVWLAVFLFTGSPAIPSVMVAALLADMILGALAGASIPLCLKWLGRDPAQASSIFLTAITDGAGFFFFLSLATMFLLA
ncbi:Magnesium transporter [uncultured delta proteobacterium]|uniref:Magnesium transporter MgtE n=1 Tax=uncultured delta proteobacterium TaxID=34034 RepID=A0A212J7A9_9DELT|nr:Magnesium transporter [uncultured delta proteobacterium]